MAKPPHALNNNNIYENHIECFLIHEYTERVLRGFEATRK